MNATFIEAIQTTQTCDGRMVDLVTLEDGKVVGIYADCIVLYPDLRRFEESDGEDWDLPTIFLED